MAIRLTVVVGRRDGPAYWPASGDRPVDIVAMLAIADDHAGQHLQRGLLGAGHSLVRGRGVMSRCMAADRSGAGAPSARCTAAGSNHGEGGNRAAASVRRKRNGCTSARHPAPGPLVAGLTAHPVVDLTGRSGGRRLSQPMPTAVFCCCTPLRTADHLFEKHL